MSDLRVVTLDELKAQMRVDFEDEDEIIKLYGCAAEDAIISGTYRTLEELKRIGYAEKTIVLICGNDNTDDYILYARYHSDSCLLPWLSY